jgi:CheY-like chemotaxis protein
MKRRANVLVVDDEKTVCHSCKKILTREGYDVDMALSAEEALSKVRGNGFDAVITDWKMPKIDGLELTRRIKEEKPAIVVVLITGYPSVESSVKAIRSGVSDYLTKPFTPEELSDAMLRALAKGQAVPADLVLDRLVEEGIVAPRPKPKAAEVALEKPLVAPAAAVPVEEEKVGPIKFVFKSVLAPVFGRLFFVALGPIVVFTIAAGIFKAVLGKKPVS